MSGSAERPPLPGQEQAAEAYFTAIYGRAVGLASALAAAGEPQPQWAEVQTLQGITDLGEAVGWPVVVKTPRGGYDGRGVFVVGAAEEAGDGTEKADPIEVRRRIGMVFQKPNPFPKSIYDNVAYGPRVTGMKVANMDDLVEEALRGRRFPPRL